MPNSLNINNRYKLKRIWTGEIGSSYRILFILVLSISQVGCHQGNSEQPKINPTKRLNEMMQVKENSWPLDNKIERIFGLPRPETVGTNSLDNAITSLSLQGNKLSQKQIAKDFVRYVGMGEFLFLPPLSGDVIGYAQYRGFILLDINTGHHAAHTICDLLEESIVSVDWIGGNTFFFLIETQSDTMEFPLYTLKKYQITFESAELVGEINVQSSDYIAITKTGLFIANDFSVSAFDLDFNQINHPLTEYAKAIQKESQAKDSLALEELLVHPELSFAIVNSEMRGLSLVRWRDQGYSEVPLTNLGEASYFSISPDRQWFVYWVSDDSENRLFAIRINMKLPRVLETPLLLGSYPEIPFDHQVTWMPEPLSYILLDKVADQLRQWLIPAN